MYNCNGAGVRMGRRNCLKATKDFCLIFALLTEIEFGSEVLLGKLQWQPMHFCFTFLPLFLMKLLPNQLISQFSLFPVVKLQMGRLWPYVTINTHRIVYFLLVEKKKKGYKFLPSMGFLFTSQKKIVYWAGLKGFKKKKIPEGKENPSNYNQFHLGCSENVCTGTVKFFLDS